MNTLITIHLKTEGDSHKDLMVSVQKNGFNGIFDSYYLGLDDEIKTDLKGLEKINLVLKKLIEYWIKTITEAKNREVHYLPIDFSDQYTGCFRIEKKDNNLLVSYGYSLIEGYSVSPSNPGNYATSISDFEENPEFSSFSVSQDELVSSLRKIIDGL